MVAVRVAVLFVGLMRIANQNHIDSIVRSTEGCDTYVVTYVTEEVCGARFVQNNESRLLVVPESTINSRMSPIRGAPSMNQWLLLDEGLKHFGGLLVSYDTIVRTRSDLVTPPGFLYSSLQGTNNVVNARTDFMFYSSSKTFLGIFKDFFKTAKEKYAHSHYDAQDAGNYLTEYVPKVVTCITSNGEVPSTVRQPPSQSTHVRKLSSVASDTNIERFENFRRKLVLAKGVKSNLPSAINKHNLKKSSVAGTSSRAPPTRTNARLDRSNIDHRISRLALPMSRSSMVVIPERFKTSPEMKFLCGCQLGTDLHHPWRTMKACGNPSVFCSESSFTFHILSKGASCQPIFGSPNPPAHPDYIIEQIRKSMLVLNLNENQTVNRFKLKETRETSSSNKDLSVDKNHEGSSSSSSTSSSHFSENNFPQPLQPAKTKRSGRRSPSALKKKGGKVVVGSSAMMDDGFDGGTIVEGYQFLKLHNNETAVQELLEVLKSRIYVDRWGVFAKHAPTDFTLRSDRHQLDSAGACLPFNTAR